MYVKPVCVSLCLFLAVLTGKELFNYNASLFVDDDAALDARDENEFDKENKLAEELEEQRAGMCRPLLNTYMWQTHYRYVYAYI
jgi:hypothetical protein